MPLFCIRRQRKVDHCLMFGEKPTTTLSPRERAAMFQTVRPDPLRSTGDWTHAQITNQQSHRLPNGGLLKLTNVTTMELLNWRLALRQRVIQETLAKRRNAVCSEIERAWVLQGSHLEKHRHNLQVAHKLQARGLMTW